VSELNPDSKMRRRGLGDLMHPACCAVCGSGNCENGYIDIGVYFDYEGQVYLCMFCVNELADTAGLLNEAEAKFLMKQNEDLATQHKSLINLLESANEKLDHYNALFSDRFNSHPDVVNDLAEPQESSETDLGFVSDGETTESTPDEPIVSEGHSEPSRVEQPNGLDL
jgi:hypothetical protein